MKAGGVSSPIERNGTRWLQAAVAVGIFVAGVFTVSVRFSLAEIRDNLGEIRVGLESSRRDAMEYMQKEAEEHAELWRRVGYLEAKMEALEHVKVVIE